MKAFLAILCCACMLTACSDDDDTNPVDNNGNNDPTNTMTYTVDGTTVEGNATYVVLQGLHQVSMASGQHIFQLSHFQELEVGQHDFSNGQVVTASYTFNGESEVITTGTISVTRNDSDAYEATFSCTSMQDTEISNGSFSVNKP